MRCIVDEHQTNYSKLEVENGRKVTTISGPHIDTGVEADPNL